MLNYFRQCKTVTPLTENGSKTQLNYQNLNYEGSSVNGNQIQPEV